MSKEDDFPREQIRVLLAAVAMHALICGEASVRPPPRQAADEALKYADELLQKVAP